jgi:hypothetical protein
MPDVIRLPAGDTHDHLCSSLANALGELWRWSPDGRYAEPIHPSPSPIVVLQTDRLVPAPHCVACEQYQALLPGDLRRYDVIQLAQYRMDYLLDHPGALPLAESGSDSDYSGYTNVLMGTTTRNATFCQHTIAPLCQQGYLSPRVVESGCLDLAVVNEWLTTCSLAHEGLCLVKARPELQSIKLIDTYSNTVVPYREIQTPETHNLDYLCLSYVWGSGDQHIVKEGNQLATVPKTIDDAMGFTRDVGKRYLWVDSVSCPCG